MATHSSVLAWRSPWTSSALPGGLQSTGLQRVGHDWATFTDSLLCKVSGEKRHFPFFFFPFKMLYCCFFYDLSEKDFNLKNPRFNPIKKNTPPSVCLC